MRVLMVGPWRAVAMRRHIDWAVESGAEVRVVDFWSRRDRERPSSFRLAYLSPRQTAALWRAKPNRRSRAAGLRAALRLSCSTTLPPMPFLPRCWRRRPAAGR
jgi:hypothetical protein